MRCQILGWGCKFFEVEMKSDLHYKIGRAKVKIEGQSGYPCDAFSLTIYQTAVVSLDNSESDSVYF